MAKFLTYTSLFLSLLGASLLGYTALNPKDKQNILLALITRDIAHSSLLD